MVTEIVPCLQKATSTPIVAPTLNPDELIEKWLGLDVANGNATADTVAAYRTQIAAWFDWCQMNGIHPAAATKDDVKTYRYFLQHQCNAAHATIALKLAVVRRFYAAACERGFLRINPAENVRPAVNIELDEVERHYDIHEAEKLLNSMDQGNSLVAIRNRLIIGFGLLQGLRRVEITRALLKDIHYDHNGKPESIIVRGKGRKRRTYLRGDMADLLFEYLNKRNAKQYDLESPLFTPIAKNGTLTNRPLSRRGLNYLVDSFLETAGIKEEGKSCHALRHTYGHLLQDETDNTRFVQEGLGHRTEQMAIRYSALTKQKKKAISEAIQLRLNKKGSQ